MPDGLNRFGARMMNTLGLQNDFSDNKLLKVSEEKLAENSERSWTYFRKAWMGAGVVVFALLPIVFYKHRKLRASLRQEYTDQINMLLHEGIQVAKQGNLRRVLKIQENITELSALGGTIDIKKRNDMVSIVYTIKSKKNVSRAKKCAKRGEVEQCATHLKKVWDAALLTDVGISSEESDQIMLSAHQYFLNLMVKRVQMLDR
eukprot:UN31234